MIIAVTKICENNSLYKRNVLPQNSIAAVLPYVYYDFDINPLRVVEIFKANAAER